MSPATTDAPSRATTTAIVRPMPLPAPEIKATLLLSRPASVRHLSVFTSCLSSPTSSSTFFRVEWTLYKACLSSQAGMHVLLWNAAGSHDVTTCFILLQDAGPEQIGFELKMGRMVALLLSMFR